MNLFQQRAHIGFRTKLLNLDSFFSGIRQKLIIYNLQTSLTNLKAALKLTFKIHQAGGHILIFNTDPNFNLLLHKATFHSDISYFQSYYGGFLTKWNYNIKIFKRYQNLRAILGHFKDSIATHVSFDKIHRRFVGIKPYKIQHKPSLIICLQYHPAFLKEAKRNMIPTISIVESINANTLLPDFPIPANSESFDFVYNFIKLFVSITRSKSRQV